MDNSGCRKVPYFKGELGNEYRKVMMIFLVLFLLLPIEGFGKDKLGSNFKHGSEPEGFRGIKWGTDISTLKDIECKGPKEGATAENLSNRGGWVSSLTRDKYYRIGDKLKAGDVELTSITYGFLDGKFYSVTIELKGRNSFSKIRDICFQLYGQATPVDIYDYVWHGNKTVMYLECNTVSDYNAFLYLWSSKFEATIMKELKNKWLKEKQKINNEKQGKIREWGKDF